MGGVAYNVLIVDDSKTTRSIIEKALRHSGVDLGDVRFAADGVEALELLEEAWVDIVFADLNMPRMGGVELVERMADFDIVSSIPVVIVSTEGRADRIEHLFSCGVAAYVRKPFSPEELGAVVRELLDSPVPEPDESALTESFFDAVEGFAMLVAQPTDEPPPAPERAVVARVVFRGPGTQGTLAIAVPEGACAWIAQAATGEEDDTDGCDALKELANVTCGHFVDSLPGGPFRLDAPEVSHGVGAEIWSKVLRDETVLTFDVEGVPLLLSVNAAARW